MINRPLFSLYTFRQCIYLWISVNNYSIAVTCNCVIGYVYKRHCMVYPRRPKSLKTNALSITNEILIGLYWFVGWGLVNRRHKTNDLLENLYIIIFFGLFKKVLPYIFKNINGLIIQNCIDVSQKFRRYQEYFYKAYIYV